MGLFKNNNNNKTKIGKQNSEQMGAIILNNH